MRRAAPSAVIFLLLAALAAPLPGFDFGKTGGTPMCCLGKGEHKCLGGMDGSHDEGEPQGFSRADETCPYSPVALAAMHGPELAHPVAAQAAVVVSQRISVATATDVFLSASAILTRSERGPPSPSLD